MNRVSVLPGRHCFTWYPTFVRGSVFCLVGQRTHVCGPHGLDLDTAALNVHVLKAMQMFQWCSKCIKEQLMLTFIIRVDTRFVRPEFHQHGAVEPLSNPFDHVQGSRGRVPSKFGRRKMTRQLCRTSYFSAHLRPQSSRQPWIYQEENIKTVQSDLLFHKQAQHI